MRIPSFVVVSIEERRLKQGPLEYKACGLKIRASLVFWWC